MDDSTLILIQLFVLIVLAFTFKDMINAFLGRDKYLDDSFTEQDTQNSEDLYYRILNPKEDKLDTKPMSPEDICIFEDTSIDSEPLSTTKTIVDFDKYYKDINKLNQFIEEKSIYLSSPRWNQKRIDRLSIDNFTCSLCNRTGIPMAVHHCSYARVPNEPLSDLRTLCMDNDGLSGCHTKLHEKLGYPQDIDDYMNRYYWED